MLSLHFLPLHRKPPLILPLLSELVVVNGGDVFKKTRTNPYKNSSGFCVVHAVEKDSQHYEVDPDKAREALQNLDQQLQKMSQKQIATPKIRASDLKLTSDETTEEAEDFSGSFLGYLTIGLFLFTILYNILFYTVIKPSMDGPESVSDSTIVGEAPNAPVLQLLQPIPEIFVQQ